MFTIASMLRTNINKATPAQPWVSQLAGVLPLSALIDFINVPRVLHVYQLTGRMPLWCWTVTPSGSRLLFAGRNDREVCCLDRVKNGQGSICLDGRYGDMYILTSSTTMEMCLGGTQCKAVANTHPNVEAEAYKRPQSLEIVAVKRRTMEAPLLPSHRRTKAEQIAIHGDTRSPMSDHVRRLKRIAAKAPIFSKLPHSPHSRKHLVATVFGCLIWSLLTALTIILGCWISTAFLLVVLLTGCAVFSIFGRKPRTFGERGVSTYNRLVLTAPHLNDTRWRVFFGESTVLNSMLNWPLLPRRPCQPHWTLTLALRLLILGHCPLGIGSAAEQGLDAYLITFWIVFCILMQNLVFSSNSCVRDWLETSAEVNLERSGITVSSRRALINTIMALNPDTLSEHTQLDHYGVEKFDETGMLWLDAILKRNPERARWQEASRQAMSGIRLGQATLASLAASYEREWWWKFVVEGIEVAERVRSNTRLSSRFVSH
nr:hypothetical protein B0A51_12417 [Rachicladosporium sp. CCFEE 5018]